jgi:ABC-type Zn uptake system ZnuABC Zn-binding protein ZnuA
MNRIILVILIAFTATPIFAQNMGVRFSFDNVPLDHILEQYSGWTGKKVEVVRNVTAIITLRTENAVSPSDAISMVEQELKKHNIALFVIGNNRLVATWLDPRKAPKAVENTIVTSSKNRESYAERRKKRLEEMQKRLQSRDETSNTNLNLISGSR